MRLNLLTTLIFTGFIAALVSMFLVQQGAAVNRGLPSCITFKFPMGLTVRIQYSTILGRHGLLEKGFG